MILECAWHKKYFPEEVKPEEEIEPLENPGVTSGMCEKCVDAFRKEYQMEG